MKREMQKAWVPPNIVSLPSLSSQPNTRDWLSLPNFSLPSFSLSYFFSTKHSVKLSVWLSLSLFLLHCVWLVRNKEERSIEERNRREMSHFYCLGDKRNRGERLILCGSHAFYLLSKIEKKDEPKLRRKTREALLFTLFPFLPLLSSYEWHSILKLFVHNTAGNHLSKKRKNKL
jgi:hypothetical protein